MILTRLKYVLILPSFQSFVPEFIQLLSGKNTAELAVIAENLRVFRILRSLKMVSYLPVFWSWVSNSVKVIPLNLKRMYYPDFFKLGAKHWKNTIKDGVTVLNLARLTHYPKCVLWWGKKGRACNDVCLIFIFTPETLTASYLKPFRQQKWPLFLYYLSSGDQQKSLPPLMLQCYAR